MSKIKGCIRWTGWLALVATALFAVGSAQAVDAIAGFQVNSAQSSSGVFIFHFDGTTLSAVDNATVDLTVDGSTFTAAQFDLSATKLGSTAISTINGKDYSNTQFDGTFSFSTSGGQLILSAAFDKALLVAPVGGFSGALFQSTEDSVSDVVFTEGPALTSLIPGFQAPEDFSFALSSKKALGVDAEQQLKSFDAKGSFVGQTNVVPEPTSWMLVGMGLCGAVAVCRRRA